MNTAIMWVSYALVVVWFATFLWALFRGEQ
jgi:CHASE3 domain sensor protein